MNYRHPLKAHMSDPMQQLYKKIILHFISDDQPYLGHRVRINDIASAESLLTKKKQIELNYLFEQYVCLVQHLRNAHQAYDLKLERERTLRLVVAAIYTVLFK